MHNNYININQYTTMYEITASTSTSYVPTYINTNIYYNFNQNVIKSVERYIEWRGYFVIASESVGS